MSRRAFLLAVFAFSFGLTATGQVSDESSVPRISVADLKKAIDAGQTIVIDVRDAGTYAVGHIPTAILMAPENVGQKAAGLKGSKKLLVTYCA